MYKCKLAAVHVLATQVCREVPDVHDMRPAHCRDFLLLVICTAGGGASLHSMYRPTEGTPCKDIGRHGRDVLEVYLTCRSISSSSRPRNLAVQPDTATADKTAAELQLLAMSQTPPLCKGLPPLHQLKAPMCPTALDAIRLKHVVSSYPAIATSSHNLQSPQQIP